VDARGKRGGRIGFGTAATASPQAPVCLGDKETGARCNYRCSKPCSHERIGFYLFGATGGHFAWGEIAFGDAPVRANLPSGLCLNLKSEGLDGRSRSPSAP
jgi:hypothetical protein